MSTASPAEPVTTLETATPTKSPSLPNTKLSAIHRFKSLTTKSSDTSPSFPPPSWSLSESPNSGSGASNWSSEVDKWRLELERWKEQMKSGFSGFTTPSPSPKQSQHDKDDNLPEEPAVVKDSKGKGKAEPTDDGDSGEINDPKEPSSVTLAMKIKSLIDENFSFASASASASSSLKSPLSTATGSPSEPTIPGPSSSTSVITGTLTPKPEGTVDGNPNRAMFGFAVDSKLAKLLSSETMMNGGGGGIEKGKESVWTILDRMGYRNPSKGKEKEDDGTSNEDGIMFYTPLQPTTELSPEIAESVLEDDDSTSYFSSTSPTLESSNPPAKEEPKPKRVFQPSATKLSVQCTWWGFRLFIPPPVMAQLSNAHIAAAKRGAMVTAALKWLVDKAPLTMIPPQLRPAMLLLKSFSPYLGYIGAFVAWSWGRVEGKDDGNGVVLTATWLLPIAILPASWDFEVHGVPVGGDTGAMEGVGVVGGEVTSGSTSQGGGSGSASSAAVTSQVHDVKTSSPSQAPNNAGGTSVKAPTASSEDPSESNTGPTRPEVKGAEPSASTSTNQTTKESKDNHGSRSSSFRKAISRRTTPWGDVRSTKSVQKPTSTEGHSAPTSFRRTVLRRATTSNDAGSKSGSATSSTDGSTPPLLKPFRRATRSGDMPSNRKKE
ncbi:hypothetical protein L218DRAFT_952891 [Marasmius fiardii PR-910]|nr:hypothetical protein L218DRAFT_952891 [Marasmius fiardii PR-910]